MVFKMFRTDLPRTQAGGKGEKEFLVSKQIIIPLFLFSSARKKSS